MWRVGVIGDPVAHSRSPQMQQAAFDAWHIAARYERWPTTLAELPDRIASLRASEILGANVTIPHKLAVMPLLDELEPEATLIGAVNTIVARQGRLIGTNTDAEGLALALREIGWDHLEQGLILGAGGAARAAIVALHRLGAHTVCVLARNTVAAQGLVETLAPQVLGTALLWGPLGGTERAVWQRMLAGMDIIINATPVGMAATPAMPMSAEQLDLIRAGTLLLDLVTRDTPWLAAARSRELPAINGLPMLLHQGALAFTAWTGQPAPLSVMRAALHEAIPGA
jgi:shikimate dehydrogenase